MSTNLPSAISQVSFLGHGRFGAALASLVRDAGIHVRALDPNATIPADERVDSLSDLARGADVIVVAVPVPRMRDAFLALRPYLAPGQIIVDVGSVKTVPARAMAEVFGSAQPWVATHPLFGPSSLARGERPLRAVVCPNPAHPAAERTIVALFERLGCLVQEQDPEAHDRVMADTQALAFFIAKGMIDAGAPASAPFSPPSFQGIAHTIEAVRSDAGHLFAALHLENPFARESRHRFLEALAAVDHSLDAPTHEPDELAGSLLTIPDLGARSPELREARDLIDELDQELVALLARRAELARRAARAKAGLGEGVRDPAREARLVRERRRWATELGLDPESVSQIFHAILRFSRRLQSEGEPANAADPTSASPQEKEKAP
jgi:prephenate dehydrogenase